MFETITCEIDGKVARIGLNRPNVLNAMDGVMKMELLAAIESLAANTDLSVAVIFGHGKHFSTGVDLKDSAYNPWDHTPDGWGGHFDCMIKAAKGIWSLDIPVITAVKGYCLGAGCDLAMMGDLTFAREDAKFGEPEVRHGAFAPTLVIPWIMGIKKAKEFLLMGKTISAGEAQAIGMVNEVWPEARFDDELQKVLDYLCKVPKPALKVAKKAINKGYEMMGMWDAIEYNREITTLLALNKSKEEKQERNELIKKNGLKAFLEQRDKKFE